MKQFTIFILLFTSMVTFSQYNRRDGNRIGISAGVTNMSMFTSNFKTSPESGWIGGFSVRGNYYNNWSMIFGMQFTESSFSVATTNLASLPEDVKYTLSGGQVRLLLSYNVIKDHISIDFGPVLQVNGELKYNDKVKASTITGTTLLVQDIKDITKINGNGYIGISAGTKRLRAVVFYQYGLNNILNNLNKKADLILKNNGQEFKGHTGILSGQVLFNL